MTDYPQHGKGQHDQRDVPVPAVPRAGLIMVKSQFILRRLKSILDGPTMALDPHQRLNNGASGAPVGENAILPSARSRRISKPRVHNPDLSSPCSLASRSASAR